MNKRVLTLKILFILPALLAGFIFLCAFAKTVPDGVTVDGVDVGGLCFSEAAEKIRRNTVDNLRDKKLEVYGETDKYVFTYPEISFKDNVYGLLRQARKGDSLISRTSYYLCGLDEIARNICADESVQPVEPSAKFNKTGDPFTYDGGSDGRIADEIKLKADILNSLSDGFGRVEVCYKSVVRRTTLDEVKQKTVKLSAFTTYYDGENINRASNIRLAAAKLNGTVINKDGIASFNDIVGARVKERGFLGAKIIENGEYTEGVGGGVCQVSTTFYNAALLAGLKIEEYHPHSLAVGYVAPSRDAMVSGTECDLKISNPNENPVYVRAKTGKNSVTFEIYGKPDGGTYSISTQVTGEIEAEEETCDDPLKARQKKNGVKSEGYLTVTRGAYQKVVLLRKDKYLPVKGLIYEEPEPPEKDDNGDDEL